MSEIPPNGTCIPSWYHSLELGSAVMSVAANALLAFLVICRTPHELKVYRRVLLCNCVVDLMYTTASYVIELHVYFLDGIIFYTVKDVFHSSLHGRFLQSAIYWGCTYVTIFMIVIPFVYRYLAVCRNYIMSQKAFACLLLFEIGVAVISTSALYVFWWPNVLSTTTKVTLEELPCVDEGVVPHYTMEEATSLRIGGILGMYTVLVCLHYVVIAFCIYRIWRKIRSSHGMNRKTSAINRQLNHVLCLQALTPLFVAVFPILACVICITFSLDWLGRLVELATSVLSWIPIMNPTFTIIFVKSYRKTVFGPFVQKWNSVITPAPSAARVIGTDTVLAGGLSLAVNEPSQSPLF